MKPPSTIPFLGTPNFTKTFTIEFDTLGQGIGVVLIQEGRPLAFKSYQLSKRDLGKFTYEKEISTILHEIRKW